MDIQYIEVKVAFKDTWSAEDMAEHLVKKKLVASAHVRKIRSVYRWEGVLHNEKEAELICITRQELFDVVKGYIKGEHEYECPQIISTPILNISKDFAEWVDENTHRRTV